MSGKTAFVTGGTGFLGLNLIEHLTTSGWDVTALHRQSSDLTRLKKYRVRLVEGEIEDARALDRCMPQDIDAVFHVAGETSMWAGDRETLWRTNVEGTRTMVTAALNKGARKFIHTSTTGVYGMPSSPINEQSSKLGKDSFHYQRTKALAEEEVERGVGEGLDAVLMNPANIIGRYDWNSWTRFIRLAASRQVTLIPPGRHCWCDAVAVVRAHEAAATKGRTGENYVLGGDAASYAEIVRLVGHILNRPVNTVVGRRFVMRLASNAMDGFSILTKKKPRMSREAAALLSTDISCKSDKAIRELDYRPTTVESMLRDCIAWMQSEGLIDRQSS